MLEGQTNPTPPANRMVTYATPPLVFVILLPPNPNAVPIPTGPQAPDQDPSAGAAQSSISRCFQSIPS